MKFCERHWQSIRDEVERVGLTSLVAETGEAAMSQLERGLVDGETTIDTFEPLMQWHWAIVGNVLDMCKNAGHPEAIMYLLSTDECPLCFVNERHDEACTVPDCTENFDGWTGRAADDALTLWKSLNA